MKHIYLEKNRKVLVFGTFDGLHFGHLDFFKQAQKLGKVFVVVARDASVKRIKGKTPRFGERSRLGKVAKVKSVTQALLGDKENFVKPILKIKPHIIALGFDQKTFSIAQLQKLLQKNQINPKIIKLKSYKPHQYKSSLLNGSSKKIRRSKVWN